MTILNIIFLVLVTIAFGSLILVLLDKKSFFTVFAISILLATFILVGVNMVPGIQAKDQMNTEYFTSTTK